MLTYTYKETEEELPEDEKVIEKTGHVITFTMKDIKSHTEKLNALKSRYESELSVEQAKKTNVEMNHPFVLDFDEQQLVTIQVYSDALKNIAERNLVIGNITKQLEEYEEETKEIISQLQE
jgi:hypothetical protein